MLPLIQQLIEFRHQSSELVEIVFTPQLDQQAPSIDRLKRFRASATCLQSGAQLMTGGALSEPCANPPNMFGYCSLQLGGQRA
jgi:hypothetical protein